MGARPWGKDCCSPKLVSGRELKWMPAKLPIDEVPPGEIMYFAARVGPDDEGGDILSAVSEWELFQFETHLPITNVNNTQTFSFQTFEYPNFALDDPAIKVGRSDGDVLGDIEEMMWQHDDKYAFQKEVWWSPMSGRPRI